MYVIIIHFHPVIPLDECNLLFRKIQLSKIKTFVYSGNIICGNAIGIALQRTTTLSILIIDHPLCSYIDISHIFISLKYNKTLTELSIHGFRLSMSLVSFSAKIIN